jgi:hypothetical protein
LGEQLVSAFGKAGTGPGEFGFVGEGLHGDGKTHVKKLPF